MNTKLLAAAFAALLLASACSKETPAPFTAPVTPPVANPAAVVNEVADDGMWFDTWPKGQHLPYEKRP